MNDSLELYMLGSGSPAQAVAFARCGDDIASDILPCVQLGNLQTFRARLERVAFGVEPVRPSAADLEQFGLDLFAFAIQQRGDRVYQRLPPGPVRIQILSNHHEIQSLPWEYLQEPGKPSGPSALRLPVRVVPTIQVAAPTPRALNAQKKLKVLFVYADPADQDAVAWDEIKSTIERAFLERAKDQLEIDVVEGASEQSLASALLQKQYDIFQFSGHGQIDHNGRGELLLRDSSTQRTQPLSAERLANKLSGRGIQLVVLSACNTSTGDFTKSFSVIAQTLVENGVPAVVAYQFPVTNSAAATFAKGLYSGLLRTGDIDIAVTDGRQMLWSQPRMGNQASIDWGIPTLYRHIGASKIFQP